MADLGGNLLVRRGATAAVAASLSAVAIALLWPAVAETVLRLLLAVLAAGAAAWLLSRVVWPVASDLTAAPFRTPDEEHVDRQIPAGLRRLVDELSIDARATGGAIPYSISSTLRAEVTRRLADNHGLDPRAPAHANRVRALVSPPTWDLFQTPPKTGDLWRRLDKPVHLRHLRTILDDLERL